MSVIVRATIIDTPILKIFFFSTIANFTDLKTRSESLSSSESPSCVIVEGFRRFKWSKLHEKNVSPRIDVEFAKTDVYKG
jgi:hypothetical protein